MLVHVTTAEMQYRLDTAVRDRELAQLALMRERQDSLSGAAATMRRRRRARRVGTARPAGRTRTTWARPIGMQSRIPCPCPAV
ncbi:hypothetical protein ACQ143_07895 [Microbacterium sp. MC2]